MEDHQVTEKLKCELCGEPMPEGEEMFKFHGHSGHCPKPPLPKLEADTDLAWVIERVENQPKHTTYLSVDGNSGSQSPSGRFIWQGDPHQALRFSRPIDAKLFIGAMLSLSDHLPHSKTLKGLRDGDLPPFAIEHMWLKS
jgi:hypothetical protein